jgi:glycosyltransferase involved in cell wall biosynthesis
VVIGGEFTRASGLGEGARLMHAALRAHGVPCFAIAAGLGPDQTPLPYPGLTTLDLTPPAAPLILHVNAPSFAASLLRLPRAALKHRRIIGYWAWELSALPPEWRGAGNLLHEIWVPSAFTAASLREAYPGRVRVVPHPLAAAPMLVQPDRAGFAFPKDTLVVLVSFSLASGMARKNPEAAIAAFRQAFGTRQDVLLVLKAGQAGHAPAALAQLQNLISSSPNIKIMTETLTAERNCALIASSDIVMSLHRSEGFGLVPAEAMLLGCPVIATDYGGSTDFIHTTCAIPIPYHLTAARDETGVYSVPGAVWVEADIDAAASALILLADNADLRLELGGRAQNAAQKYFSITPLLDALASLAGT